MNIHEYQAKELLARFGVTVPQGRVAYTPEQASFAASELGGWHWAVKAQIHSAAPRKFHDQSPINQQIQLYVGKREVMNRKMGGI